jgi:hypothetical protein
MRSLLVLLLVGLGLSAQVVQESFARDPGPLDFIRGEGHEQAILQSLTGDALVGLDAQGRVVPRLAIRWEERGGWVRFHLRKEARFEDGTTVGPEDALWTLHAIQADPKASPTKRAILEGVKARIQAGFLELNAGRPSQRLLCELARIPIAKKGRGSLGSGPFRLRMQEGEWHLAAHPHFLEPRIQGLRFRLVADEQAVLQNLQKGWLSIGVPPPRRGLKLPESHRELRQPFNAQLIAWSRVGDLPLRCLERWRAEAFPEELFGRQASASRGLWPESLGFRVRKMAPRVGAETRGQRWEILYTAGDAVAEKALLALRERGRQEGAMLEPRPVEAALLFERLQKGDFQVACAVNIFDPHPWSVLDLLAPQGAMNFSGWKHPSLAKLLPRLVDSRSPAWEELQDLWAGSPASLPILDFSGVVWVDKRLVVSPSPLGLYLTTPGAAGWSWQR